MEDKEKGKEKKKEEEEKKTKKKIYLCTRPFLCLFSFLGKAQQPSSCLTCTTLFLIAGKKQLAVLSASVWVTGILLAYTSEQRRIQQIGPA